VLRDRDSLFGERVHWQGSPVHVRCPQGYKTFGLAFALVAFVAALFAVIVALALHVSPKGMLLMSVWCASLSLLCFRFPVWLRSQLRYSITDTQVVWRAGRVRRSIERKSISFARIRWNPEHTGTGDLTLVRAVQTGALKRTLTLTLSDVAAPDRVWAQIRGEAVSESMGDCARALSQRLHDSERVLWTGTPIASPWSVRRSVTTLLSLAIFASALRMVLRMVKPVGRMHGVLSEPLFVGLVLAVSVAVLLVVLVAGVIAYHALLKPSMMRKTTRYFVTDKRVLIRRGFEELSLDRSMIADAIAAPSSRRSNSLFLVIDGPRSRSLFVSGAFGEDHSMDLSPVLLAIEDIDTAQAILLPRAA
jgi:hypothetical protein